MWCDPLAYVCMCPKAKYGALTSQQVEQIGAEEVGAMDAYALAYGWDARRQVRRMQWWKVVGGKW